MIAGFIMLGLFLLVMVLFVHGHLLQEQIRRLDRMTESQAQLISDIIAVNSRMVSRIAALEQRARCHGPVVHRPAEFTVLKDGGRC
jgi:hypothetical protein